MSKVFLCLFVLLSGLAQADVTSILGDKDCFGVPGAVSCPDGSRFETDLGGVFFTDYRTLGDPAFTDIWEAPDSVSYVQTYLLPNSPASASLELRIAGIHDINTGQVYSVLFDGTAIGVIPPNIGGFEEVKTYTFDVPVALLSGSDTISWSGTDGDGYIIDYSQLTITGAVPKPGSLLLLLTAASLIVGLARKHRG